MEVELRSVLPWLHHMPYTSRRMITTAQHNEQEKTCSIIKRPMRAICSTGSLPVLDILSDENYFFVLLPIVIFIHQHIEESNEQCAKCYY